jgi:hypothetical protein
MRHIVLDPYIPLALWVPLALAAAGLWGWYAAASRGRLTGRRRGGVLALMAAAIAVPLAILLNPTWLEQVPPPPGKPLLTVLVDRSASMATEDAPQHRTRYQAACRFAAAVEQLSDRYEVRLRWFAGDCSPTTVEALKSGTPDGMATDLATAIDESLDQERPQGQAIVLASDGGENTSGGTERLRQSVARANAMAAPVYTHTIGGPGEVRDLEVSVNLPQEVAFVGQQVPVVVALRQRGDLARHTRLSLRLEGKEVESRQAKLVPDGTSEEVFHVSRKAPGLYRYEVEAAPLPGEVTMLNNTARLLVRVVDQPIRVLLLEGKPYWDTKFLIRTLSMDDAVELTSVVQLAAGRLLERRIEREKGKGEKREKGKGEKRENSEKGEKDEKPSDQWTIQKDAGKLLADANALAAYQIVILGRNAEVFLSDEALARLKQWLTEKDGSLVCFRGAPSSQISQRLGELMPVRWTPAGESRFRVQLTGAGQSLRWLPAGRDGDDPLAGMPSLASVTQAEAKPALAVVLAAGAAGSGQPAPVMTYQQLGGRVVVLEGAGMWRWAFLPPQYQKRDEVYGSLWRSLVRWLVANVGLLPSERMALRTDKITYNSDENATATLLVRDSQAAGPPPRIELSGGTLQRPRTISCVPRGNAPGQFHAALGRLPEGRYLARVAGAGKEEISAVAAFDVQGNLKEWLDVRARPDLMKFIAQHSGGAVLEDADAGRLARQFDQQLSRSRPQRTTRAMAWDRWWVLLGAFGLWAAGWGLRRWSGLV